VGWGRRGVWGSQAWLRRRRGGCRQGVDRGLCGLGNTLISLAYFKDKWREMRTPFCLHAKEDPHPAPQHFEKFHDEDSAFEVIEMVKMGRELETPCAA